MSKWYNEVRDPVHGFIRFTDREKTIIDSRPVQRLRNIHQLSTAFKVYPGATHRRFEHSLGTMELTTRIYDSLLAVEQEPSEKYRNPIDDILKPDERASTRSLLRMAALCHDIGHLPFSHGAEYLLPDEGNWCHEKLTYKHCTETLSQELGAKGMNLDPARVAKLAIGPKKWNKMNSVDTILSEIIVGDALGSDRMDFLLRDSLHLGVPYGLIDQSRLIDCIRLLPKAEGSKELMLGITEGGLHCVEALLVARYFLYSQVCFHSVRISYDVHLRDFMISQYKPEWLIELDNHLSLDDNGVLMKAAQEARDSNCPLAKRLTSREHFRLVYNALPNEISSVLLNQKPAQDYKGPSNLMLEALSVEFDKDLLRENSKRESSYIDFPVLMRDGSIRSARSVSEMIEHIPEPVYEYVFADKSIQKEVEDKASKLREKLFT